ncbi:hypothetical protein BISA_2241 [Bifidobacterium saguini DSM 23967]|uniref:DUF4913 domain-containing protein n=2 Tax=Bifidobacterium saguini TaxID=762210 RepID=A0A087D5R7_9BIFI|nr:DUF4913 domain-containing protein [Bifidobacterium saguini]KFI90867.1 hypothetical protein BISA_2241 [Bifidobacterium saguini DSM 23967]QTB90721.1 DUF4913 domain-containing protein [Bifidobacterium saguini]
MNEHNETNEAPTTSGPDGEEWRRAVGAARTLLSSECGWLELFTRAVLEEKGVPYGAGLPNPEPPRIPANEEIETSTVAGTGTPKHRNTEKPSATENRGEAGKELAGEKAEPRTAKPDIIRDEPRAGYENPPEPGTETEAIDHPDNGGTMMPETGGRTAGNGLSGDEGSDLGPARSRDMAGQFGARMRRGDTYYPNLAAFVERFVANVFCYHQSASVNMKWVPDWWRYPALVFPLDAMWRAYENARKSPGQMMIFYIQAASMLDRVFDKDRGIVASLDCEQKITRKGEPLPCERPGRAWREPILETLSVPGGVKEDERRTAIMARRKNGSD